MEGSFRHTSRWLHDTYCAYVGCRTLAAGDRTLRAAQETKWDRVACSSIPKTIHRIQSLVDYTSFQSSTADACMLAYMEFNDDLFRDLLNNNDRQRTLLRCAVRIFVQTILQPRASFYHIFEYICAVLSCAYWIYVQPHVPSVLHLYIVRLLVCTYVLRMAMRDLYHGFWTNGYVGVKIALLSWTNVFHESCVLTRHNRYHMKVWVDLYTIWHAASACGSGRGSPDLTRSVCFSFSSLCLEFDDIHYHEFARTFQLLFRYMILFDQPDFMGYSDNLISCDTISSWGTINKTTLDTLYRKSRCPHAMLYRTD